MASKLDNYGTVFNDCLIVVGSSWAYFMKHCLELKSEIII